MDTAELKNTKKNLITWVKSLTDESLLGLLNSVKLSNEGKSLDWWEEITDMDRDNISQGIKDYQAGNTMTSKEFWNGLTNE